MSAPQREEETVKVAEPPDPDTRTIGVVEDVEGGHRALAHRDVAPVVQTLQPVMSDDEIGRIFRLAKMFAESRLYKGAEDEELTATQAFAKILIGRDLGISPSRALAAIDIVKGNAQLRGVLLGAFVKESPNYDYDILEHDQEHAKIEFWGISKRTGQWTSLGVVEFSVEDAKAKGLFRSRGQWDNWPENMCIWRCLSNGVKFWCPDLLKGIPVYTEADSFEDRSVDGSGGDGDGSGPGWQGLTATQIRLVEAVIDRAAKLGHVGIANSPSVQVKLGLKTPDEVERWIKEATVILDGMEAETVAKKEEAEITDADVVDEAATSAPAESPAHAPIHVVADEGAGLFLYEHACGASSAPLSGKNPIEGQVLKCPGCGEDAPVATVRVKPKPEKRAGGDMPPPLETMAQNIRDGQDEAQAAALDRQALDKMAASDALADTDPERAEALARVAEELHEQAVALRGDEPDTLPGL